MVIIFNLVIFVVSRTPASRIHFRAFMKIPDIIIAVDGFSATGKSTFAKLVASEYSLLYLDSGALYRAVTLYAIENGMITEDGIIDEPALAESLDKIDVQFRFADGVSKTFIGNRCIEDEIRTMTVSSQVSPISTVASVRKFVDCKLHEFGRRGSVIMDGRDIGSSVFPEADVKIFMIADDDVRARRRFGELAAKGENPVMEEVLNNIRSRDFIDSHRDVSPLTRAKDAFVIDNSDMTLHEEVIWFKGLIQGKYGILD